jgi:hypothetical protein
VRTDAARPGRQDADTSDARLVALAGHVSRVLQRRRALTHGSRRVLALERRRALAWKPPRARGCSPTGAAARWPGSRRALTHGRAPRARPRMPPRARLEAAARSSRKGAACSPTEGAARPRWTPPRAHPRMPPHARAGRVPRAHAGSRRALTHGKGATCSRRKAPRAPPRMPPRARLDAAARSPTEGRHALTAGKRAHPRNAPALRPVGARPSGHVGRSARGALGLVEHLQAGHLDAVHVQAGHVRRGPRGALGSWSTSRRSHRTVGSRWGAGPRGARPGEPDAGLAVRAGARGARPGRSRRTVGSRWVLGAWSTSRRSQTRARRTRASWREQGTTSEQDPERIRLPAEPVGSWSEHHPAYPPLRGSRPLTCSPSTQRGAPCSGGFSGRSKRCCLP